MELKNNALFKETCFIGGKWIESDSGEKIKVDNQLMVKLLEQFLNVQLLKHKKLYKKLNRHFHLGEIKLQKKDL